MISGMTFTLILFVFIISLALIRRCHFCSFTEVNRFEWSPEVQSGFEIIVFTPNFLNKFNRFHFELFDNEWKSNGFGDIFWTSHHGHRTSDFFLFLSFCWICKYMLKKHTSKPNKGTSKGNILAWIKIIQLFRLICVFKSKWGKYSIFNYVGDAR